MNFEVLQLHSEIEVAHIGPPLDKGRRPSVLYCALSAKESLDLDPYNQGALHLSKQGIRVFSIDLPAHGPNLNAIDAIKAWAEAFREGQDLLLPFLEKATFAIEELIHRGLIIREKLGIMGLSRGGLVGAHLATKLKDLKAFVAFAPMTELTFAKEFEELPDLKQAAAYNLEKIDPLLYDKTIRFYIGNRDTRVGTEKCFQLMKKCVDLAFQNEIRSPSIEMIISPSIGHMGHGTSKEIFEAGADWLAKKLGVIQ